MMTLVRRFFKTYKGMVASVGILLLSVVGVVYGILPASERMVELVERRRNLLQEVQVLNSKLAVLESADESTLRNSLLTLLSAIPADKSIPSIFTSVEQTALVSGVSIDTMTIGNPGSLATESAQKQSNEEKKLGSGIIAFAVSVNGTPGQIRDFLDQTVRVRRFLRVRYADLSFFSGTNASLRAGLDTFWTPFPVSLGETASPVQQLTQSEEILMKTISALPDFSTQDAGSASASTTFPLSRDPFAP